jgi:hypothetical protein
LQVLCRRFFSFSIQICRILTKSAHSDRSPALRHPISRCYSKGFSISLP